jgi:aerobic carbon-monoxide dehydrogenase large subunit
MIGQRVRRREDPRFLTGAGSFVDDVELPGAMWVTFIRSYLAHATIRGIDSSAATALPGTQVFTAAELDQVEPVALPMPALDDRMRRPQIARDTVRFVGEVVAVVVTETPAQGVDAAELVIVDYDPLPVVVDPRAALRDDTVLQPDAGTNICLHMAPEQPDPGLFDGCDVVISGEHVSQRLAVCPLEPRSSAARVEEDGRLTLWLSTQTPHQDRAAAAGALGMEPDRIRVVAPDVGGGFGGKMLSVEDVLLAAIAIKTGRPVRWTETRSENLVSMPHGRAQTTAFELGGDRDGTVKALRLKILQEAGAYPALGAILPTLTSLMASGVYRIPKIEVEIDSVLTNTTPTGPLRGAGRPEATQTIERAIDLFAAEVAIDPAEVRRRNFIPADAFPYTTASGAPYDCGDYAGALDRVLEAAGYDQLRAEQAKQREAGGTKLLGIGMSTYVEVTNGLTESEFASVEITDAGDAILKTGSLSHGQGHETTFAQIVGERLGMAAERVTVLKGDTDSVARGSGTYGSKSTQIGGAAAAKASTEVVDRAKQLVAEELEANPDDLVLDFGAGRFHVAGAPEPALSWSELAGRLDASGRLSELSLAVDFEPAQPTFPFGAHLAVVEVDAETGAVLLQRIVTVDDAGRIINPLVAEGQVHGGIATGIAQALHEEFVYDEDGNPQNSNLVTYGFPGATELPFFETVSMETPTPINELGAKGIGESGTIGATPAVHAAVLDAVAPLGIRRIDMPATGERVWRAIREAAAGAATS